MSTVLVIDDEPDLVEFIRIVLEDEGYDVSTVTDGETGLKKAVELKPGLVVLDVMMPGIDGWEICKRLKSSPETKDIPVIFLTAKTQTIDKMLGLHVLKAEEYVIKPFDPKELVEKVKKHLPPKSG